MGAKPCLLVAAMLAHGCGRIGFDPGSGGVDPTGDGGGDSGDGSVIDDGPQFNPPGLCAIGGWCWENQTPHGFSMADMWAAAPNDVWGVGGGGLILHWDGTTWAPVASGTTESLTAVWGSSANDVWAAGNNGVIRRWQGSTWSPVA